MIDSSGYDVTSKIMDFATEMGTLGGTYKTCTVRCCTEDNLIDWWKTIKRNGSATVLSVVYSVGSAVTISHFLKWLD